MKKLILIMAGCAALFATSCSSDNTTKTAPTATPSDIAGSYTAQNATVKISGISYDMVGDQKIEISGEAMDNMTVMIPAGVVPGEDAVTFTNVKFSNDNTSELTGAHTNSDRTLNLNGYYTNKGLTLAITPEYKASLVGTWNFQKPLFAEEDEYTDLSTVIYMQVTTETGMVTFMGQEVEASEVGGFFNLIAGGMLRTYDEEGNYTGALQNVKFLADGNITAEYNVNFMGEGAPVFVNSPINALRWYVKENKVYLVPNLNLMTRAGLSTTGIQMEYKLSDNKDLSIYFTKEQIAPVMAIANSVVGVMADDALEGLAPLIKMVVGELTTMAFTATEFSLGIQLERTVAAE